LSRASSTFRAVLFASLLAVLAACGGRPRPLLPHAALRSATLQQLVDRFNQVAGAVTSLSLKMDLTARAGKHKYPGVAAFLLVRKPSSIRLWGNFTLIGRLFDMASNGQRFELSLPSRNEFLEGRNDYVARQVKNPLENLRPQVILNALLINPIALGQNVALDPNAPVADYDVFVLQPGPGGFDRLLRQITFSRYNLLPIRQVIEDADGIHTTVATYSHYIARQGVPIPLRMTITRPIEGYTLTLKLDRKAIAVNVPFTVPHTFTLQPPRGSTIVHLGRPARLPADSH
jgi:hypothetical protein